MWGVEPFTDTVWCILQPELSENWCKGVALVSKADTWLCHC